MAYNQFHIIPIFDFYTFGAQDSGQGPKAAAKAQPATVFWARGVQPGANDVNKSESNTKLI